MENDAREFSKQLIVPAWKESALSSPSSFSLKKRKLIVPAIPNSDFFKEKFQFSSLKDAESSETVREERTATPQKATILGESMKEGETICKPNPNDVLFVRGKECEQHSGNLQFRKLCWNHRQIYKVASRCVCQAIGCSLTRQLIPDPLSFSSHFASNRKEKRAVAKQIFGIVQNKTPSGRFLRLAAGAAKHATPESDFVVADEEKTLVRITRILREQERQADDAAAEAAIQQAVASLPKIDRCASNTSDSQQLGFAVASKSDERCRRDSKTATEPVSSKNGQGPVIIQDPHRNDVIFGRGNCHTRFGNMQFRQFCWDIRKTYDETTRLVPCVVDVSM